MEQLSGLDAGFLSMESPRTYGHVTSVALFDPSGPHAHLSSESVRAVIEDRLHLLPMFRRRLVEVPFNIDQPYWIEDPDFDLDFHLRHIAVPPPGDRAQLGELAARIAARHLDRSRPLWEMYLIDGLEDGSICELTKIHHACIDGVAGSEILSVLLDLEPSPEPTPPPDAQWEPDQIPSPWTMLGRGAVNLVRRPAAGVKLLRDTIPALPSLGANLGVRLPMVGPARRDEVLARPTFQAPATPFNGVISPHRRFAYGGVELERVKRIKNAVGGTVNDVVMALCAGALRRWLVDHDALPTAPLVAMVPVSVRVEEHGALGNRISAMLAALPTNEADPRRRLELTRAEMAVAKEEHGAVPASLLQDFLNFTPPSVAGMASRVVTRTRLFERVNIPFNLIISNVPGPQFPIYHCGAEMQALYPLSPIADGVGLNMTLMSYRGSLDFGLIADRDMVPDIWALLAAVDAELDELEAATTA